MDRISDIQKSILSFIQQEIDAKGYPPSVREICNAVNLRSTSTVHGHLSRLEKKGYLQRDPAKPRAIELLNDPLRKYKRETSYLPVISDLASDAEKISEQSIEEVFPIPTAQLPEGEHFMLKVKDDSMQDAGILNGDYVIVHKQSQAHSGDIVVVTLDEGTSVRRFFKEKNYVRLQPENYDWEPVILSSADIIGLVTGLFRKL